ncbi:MAG: hypothetical protein JNM93_14310 [Bacteriovoracaceae bacterium]|nr:hypothetical protein [Bacteriovoracaceae bacterium]
MNNFLALAFILLSNTTYANNPRTYICKSEDGDIQLQYTAKIGKWTEAQVPHNIYLQIKGRKGVLDLVSYESSVTLSPAKNPNLATVFSSGNITKNKLLGGTKLLGTYRFSTEQKMQDETEEYRFSGNISLTSKSLGLFYRSVPIKCEIWL